MEDSYRESVRELSERLVAAQSGIRILDAIKWDESVRAAFFASGCRELPPVDRAYYERRPLACNVEETRERLDAIEREIVSRLGRVNAVGRLMRRMCDEYQSVLDMLEARGTPRFARLAQRLYGRSTDAFHAGGPSLADLAGMLEGVLQRVDARAFLEAEHRDITPDEAVVRLQERLDQVFTSPENRVRVSVSDGIVADAAAGSDYIKLRKDAVFSDRDLRVLEAHEGWVHVGTTLNGRAQPYCTFLGKGTPSTTITQEGLALLVEIVSFRSHPARLRRVTDRMRGIHLAEEGANFLDVFEILREAGRPPEEAYTTCQRVFRGSTPDGGPFTKDLAYGRGFVLAYAFIGLAVRRGLVDRIPLLFCGKVTVEDVGVLSELVAQGLVEPPRYLPPPVGDLSGLTAWMACSGFLHDLDVSQLEADFARLLA